MLKYVHIKNLALIREAEIDFENGLNIMTGETGAGKSIIISSVNIALGGKANKGLIRSGCDHGLVELIFVTEDPAVFACLDRLGVERDGNNITISRKITPDTSISKINGETVTLANIKMVTSLLIDIHGQHDHQSLLDPSNHLQIIDSFAGAEVASLKGQVRAEYEHYKSLRRMYRDYNLDKESLDREIDLLQYEQMEIEKASLKDNEDEELEAEYKSMSSYEGMKRILSEASYNINDEQEGASSRISRALAQVSSAASAYPEEQELLSFRDALRELEGLSRDISHDLSAFVESHSFDEERLRMVQNRLDEINRLKSKYGNTLASIRAYYNDICARLDHYADYSQSKKELEEKMRISRTELNHLSHSLSDARQKAAGHLAPLIRSNLQDLNFLSADFRICFTKAEKISSEGYDRAEFMISMNPGEPVRPLSKIASGGELSRIMLAIKSSAADRDAIPTLVFDEIDSGISGRTAQKVSEKLFRLSLSHQIICITHLPQIAAMADAHFSIHKEYTDGSTISGIEKLDREKEVGEIARLVGGAQITPAVMENARELKSLAVQFKEQERS